MRWRSDARRGGCRRLLMTLAVLAVGVGWPARDALRASSFGDATTEPLGRGRVVLDARETVLREQADRAERVARTRGLTLYRVLRFAALERAGNAAAAEDAGRLGGRAVALGSAILERDLVEARSLRAEWQRVRAMRTALAGGGAGTPGDSADAGGTARPGPPQVIAAAAPGLLRPVAGKVLAPYGVAREPSSGAWFFRTALSFSTRPAELVRSPVGGRVSRVGRSQAGGDAVVVEADAHGWTIIVSGLAEVSVAPGQSVRPGEPLGRAEAERASVLPVRLEAWRGRAPVDPAAQLGRR